MFPYLAKHATNYFASTIAFHLKPLSVFPEWGGRLLGSVRSEVNPQENREAASLHLQGEQVRQALQAE